MTTTSASDCRSSAGAGSTVPASPSHQPVALWWSTSIPWRKMGKTLVIAEKPSVARDLAAALPGSFKQAKDKTHLEGDDYVITWAVGHLVGLAEPDEYDPKLKK